MNARSYKLILLLLSICVLCIVLLQGYWIRNLYLQKKEAFDRAVYASLEQIGEKVRERRNLQALKMTYVIQGSDTIVKTPSRNRLRVASNAVTTYVVSNNRATTSDIEVLKNEDKVIRDSVHITGEQTNVNVLIGGKKARVTVFNNTDKKGLDALVSASDKMVGEAQEMTKLVDKMITEIRVMDTETEHPDSLKSLISGVLKNKGLFLPFEFAVQKPKEDKKEAKIRSKGFDDKALGYKSDLSADNVIIKDEFLLLQFPGQSDFVLAGMKGSLFLSLFFSLLIIGVFYYVMRLIYSQKKLSEIRNDFVNNMTHELKTPIATISLALDAIRNPVVRNDSERFGEYNRILKEENQKLNTHVERVLQISLLDKGRLQMVKEKADPAELIRAAISSYRLQIAEQKAEVSFVPPDEKVSLQGDAYHLQTVITNLLDNALKYSTPPARISIVLAKLRDEVVISIKDNGIGIDASQHRRIFEKFYRVQGGDLHDVKGFGLGLSYVKSIVEAHGGTVEVRSEKGKGSEFVLVFRGA